MSATSAVLASAGGAHRPPIEAHRLLGDGHTMALVREDAEIDWWCAPLPHDDPLLWSLLDADGGAARFLDAHPAVAVHGAAASGDEPVAAPLLRTVLEVPGGVVEVQDALLPASVGGSALVRVVHARAGHPTLTHVLRAGGFGGQGAAWAGSQIVVGAAAWRLHTIGGVTTVRGSDAMSDLAPGEAPVALVLTADPSFDVRFDNVLARLASMARSGAGHRKAGGSAATLTSRRDDALAVLRACTYAPSGAVVAAPTTSLPEAVGSDRQFDYRYSWLRDGSLSTAVAAVASGPEVAVDSLGFLEALGPERLLQAPLWTVDGAGAPGERTVEGVAGWGGSVPVRVGNEAAGQLQYDALGFVAEAVGIFVREGGRLTDGRWALVAAVAERCASGAQEPTSGIWEMRTPQLFVAADIGRWMALDHALRLAEAHDRPVPRHWTVAFEQARARVRGAVRADGLLPQVHAGPGGGEPRADASALLAVTCGLIDAHDPAANAVVDACIDRLGAGPFLRRYPADATDGFHGIEGAFVPACFWVVTALATVGRVEEAQARLEALHAALPRLLAEEVAPADGHSLGNVPLVWSHIEFVRALYALTTASAR